jgi:hypothetical protein
LTAKDNKGSAINELTDKQWKTISTNAMFIINDYIAGKDIYATQGGAIKALAKFEANQRVDSYVGTARTAGGDTIFTINKHNFLSLRVMALLETYNSKLIPFSANNRNNAPTPAGEHNDYLHKSLLNDSKIGGNLAKNMVVKTLTGVKDNNNPLEYTC